jgi:hypothetical protein
MMLTFTFAGDEAGDISFAFEKGASRYFVVTVIATQDPESLRTLLDDVRQQAHLPKGFDFHFNSLASAKLRNLVFASLGSSHFEAWGIIVDQTLLPDTFKFFISGLDFYLFFVSELIRQIPAEKREGGTLILDEFGNPERTRDELKRIMRAREIKHGFGRISIRRSQSEPLIQVADLVAGAILRRDTHNQSGAFDMISGKVRKLVDYAG